MKSFYCSLAATAAIWITGASGAAERTATIEVTELWCSSCPYIAAQAVKAIPSAVIIGGFYDPNLQLAHFIIQYDDELTTLAAVIGATEEFGYPATLVEEPES